MMHQQLPLELIDAILEHVSDDKSVLAACCLVCKAWIHPSRRLLFAAVDLNHWNVNGLLAPSSTTTLTSPIPPYIRCLRLTGDLPSSLWNCLPLFENLRSLTITHPPPPCDFTSAGAAFSYCNTVVRLHLCVILFETFADLAQIVCAFRQLNALIISSSWLGPDPPSPDISPPLSLRALELQECAWGTVLEWLLSLHHIPHLHTPCVREDDHPEDATTLPRFLKALGPHLENLWLELDKEDGEFSINLVHNPRLHSLTLQFWRELPNPRCLSRMLSEAFCYDMEEIVIGLARTYTEIDATAWNHVDAILAQPQFSKLRTFRIRTNTNQSWFIDRLPQSHSRGILSIRPLGWELSVL